MEAAEEYGDAKATEALKRLHPSEDFTVERIEPKLHVLSDVHDAPEDGEEEEDEGGEDEDPDA